MEFDFVLKDCLALQKGQLLKRNIGINKGKIGKISVSQLNTHKPVNCRGKILLPGLIDSHVHFRFPGMTHKEDWTSGTKAALAGGITTVLDMPNTVPPLTNTELLAQKREEVAKEALCNFGFHFGASKDNADELRKAEGIASIKVFMGSSTGSLLVDDLAILEKIFRIAKKRGLVVTLHAEDEAIIKTNFERAKAEFKNSARFHNEIRSPHAERVAVEKALALQKKIGNKIHFLHVSTEESLGLIADAKKQHSGITCEVTPHHLFLCEDNVKELLNFGKMNPPLRSKQDQQALWQGISSGIVDCIGTDHAPHTVEEKRLEYFNAPSGVPGIETMLSLLLDAVAKEKISIAKIAELCCENPAKIFGLTHKGVIRESFDADLVLVDLKGETTIKNENLKTKCKWSPFHDWKLQGRIEKVWLCGKQVVQNE